MKKKKELKKWFCSIMGNVLLTAAMMAGLPEGAFAGEVGGVEIRGYGHQTFMITDENEYLGADNDGSWNNNAASILFTSKVTDDTTIWIQLHGSGKGLRVDWVFVDYMFSDSLSAQIGQIKFPMGLYNSIRDVRFLQLSTMLPYMYEEDADMIHEAYRGVRAIYNQDLGGGGEIILTPFGGQLSGEEEEPEPEHEHGQVFGGNITYRTPLDGLSLTCSASTSDMENPGESTKGDMTMLHAGVDYVNYGLDLKAEYITMEMSMKGMGMSMDKKHNSFYAQAGYTFFDKLTPFVRYDSITTNEDDDSNPSNYQKSIAVGAGYKINYNIALKAEYHINFDGYAMPVATEEVEAGAGKDNWNMFVASLNFIF